MSTFDDCYENFKHLICYLNEHNISNPDLNYHISRIVDFWNNFKNVSVDDLYKLKENNSHITAILVETKEEELKALWAKYLTSMCELRCNLLKYLYEQKKIETH